MGCACWLRDGMEQMTQPWGSRVIALLDGPGSIRMQSPVRALPLFLQNSPFPRLEPQNCCLCECSRPFSPFRYPVKEILIALHSCLS